MELKIGDRVTTTARQIEAGFKKPNTTHVHAEAGDAGIVEHIGRSREWILVRFQPSGTAFDVHVSELKPIE